MNKLFVSVMTVLAMSACAVEDDELLDEEAQEAITRPYANGCNAFGTVDDCRLLKGILFTPEEDRVCGFVARDYEPGVIFEIARPAGWKDSLPYTRLTGAGTATLGIACNPFGDGNAVTYVPANPAQCAQVGGFWRPSVVSGRIWCFRTP